MRTLLLALCLMLPVWAQESIPFEYLPGSEDGLLRGHLISIPVTVGEGVSARFILDTGIGVDLISTRLAARLHTPGTGTSYTGQRMSGQKVTLPLSYLSNLKVGSQFQRFGICGLWDFKGFLPDTPAFAAIEGFLGLRFFQHRPFTLDYPHQQLVLETPASLRARLDGGLSVPLELDDDEGVSLTAFAPLELAVGRAKVEVDTGSDSLILHSRFMAPLGISEGGPEVRVVRAKDETDFAFTRWFTRLPGSIRLDGHQPLELNQSRVMFQSIIHDGLIGDDYLRRFVVTFDLGHSRMIMRPAGNL